MKISLAISPFRKKQIREVAELLLYKGPSVDEIIKEAVQNKHTFDISRDNDLQIISVHSILPYDIKVVDQYFYNNNTGELMKHTVKTKNKFKVVFNKYSEAKALLSAINQTASLVC